MAPQNGPTKAKNGHQRVKAVPTAAAGETTATAEATAGAELGKTVSRVVQRIVQTNRSANRSVESFGRVLQRVT